jgi:nicotine blue oxidoreductase
MASSITPVGAVVLAAGAGRRMGRPKATLEIAGQRLLQHHVDALSARVPHVVVVLGAAIVDVVGARVVVNPEWSSSAQADSLRCALLRIGPGPVVVTPVDASPVRRRTLDALITAGGAAVPIGADGVPGHPVVIDAAIADAVRQAPPAGGLRALLSGATKVLVDDPWIGVDLDTPDAWARWAALWTTERP